ncbi:MAG: hypothetical protein ACJA1C_002258 [Crocinitomicaceae bacterium]|jgi:hypothetical protein
MADNKMTSELAGRSNFVSIVKKSIPAISLFLLIVGLEYYASKLAYFTSSEIHSKIYILLLIVINLLAVVLYLLKKNSISLILMLSYFLFLVPNQLYLGNMMNKLREETANVTNYAYQQKVDMGSYPSSLNEYEFTYPNLKRRISYELRDPESFVVEFYVQSSSTSHTYYNKSNLKWFYYPD